MSHKRLTGTIAFSLLITLFLLTWEAPVAFTAGPGLPPFDPIPLKPNTPTPFPPPINRPLSTELRAGQGLHQRPDGLWYKDADVDRSLLGPLGMMHIQSVQETGGPDDFGYTWDDSEPFQWIDVSDGTDTGLNAQTYSAGPIEIGFPFKFYENTYDELYISRYGFVAFSEDTLWRTQSHIPNPGTPNDVIAPYWVPNDDVNYVRYKTGGTAPNRWFIIEWNRVQSDYDHLDEYTFEVILHENGDIVFQYGQLTRQGYYWCESAGIEDSMGLDGLSVIDFCALQDGFYAVRISRPPVQARVGMHLLHFGKFAHPGMTTAVEIPIHNTGELGADTYDISIHSPWPASSFQADGVTPLSDTNGNGIPDTGSVEQGETTSLVIKVDTPANTKVGDNVETLVTVQSALDTTKKKVARVHLAVPTAFAQVYRDSGNGISTEIQLIKPSGHITRSVGTRSDAGWDVAVAELPNKNFIYVWDNARRISDDPWIQVDELFYAIVSPQGKILRPRTQLTHYTGTITTHIRDGKPAIGVTPDGEIGLFWEQRRVKPDTWEFNENLFFASLDINGNVVAQPRLVTLNGTWGDWNTLYNPAFGSPQIIGTRSGQFLLAWDKSYYIAPSQDCSSYCHISNIWTAVLRPDGSVVQERTRLTIDGPGFDNGYEEPSLALAGDNRILVTYSRFGNHPDILFMVLDDQGHIVKNATWISNDGQASWDRRPDVSRLSDGSFVVAWTGDPPQNIGEQGWRGSYYNNENLSGDPVLVRDDSTIDFNWRLASPAPGVNPNFFSVRWEGTIRVPAGDYEFIMGSDDGSRLWIDGRKVMDNWDICCQYWYKTVTLTEGAHHVVMEMHEHDGAAWARLYWRKANTSAGIRFATLDSNFNVTSGPHYLDNPASILGDANVSVTHDDSGRAVLTWMDYDFSYHNNLYYALVDGAGHTLTPPTIFHTSTGRYPYVETSYYGHGNTTFSWQPAATDLSVRFHSERIRTLGENPVSLRLTYTNLGSDGTNLHLVATLDPALRYVSDTSGVSPTVQGHTINWSLGSLPLFGSESFTLTLGTDGATPGSDLPIQLEIDSSESDANPDDNHATAFIHLVKPMASGVNVLDVASYAHDSLDPTKNWYWEVVAQLFAGLTRIDSETLEPIPDLAASWQMSNDAKTFTFTLRDGLTWSDGRPLTAEDVRFGILHFLSESDDDYPANLLYLIKNAESYRSGAITDPDQVGITVLDAHRVRFELTQPASFFPGILSEPFARPLPKHVVEKWGESWADPAHIVTSGPYLLDEFLPNQYLVLKKNPLYYNTDEIEIAYVNVHLVDNIRRAWDMYGAGVLDTAPIYDEDITSSLEDPYLSQELHKLLGWGTSYLGFNLANSPFDNVYVRRAFAAAIDRRGLIDHLTVENLFDPTLTFTPSGVFGFVNGYKESIGHPYNKWQARYWLARAGGGGWLPPITLTLYDSPSSHAAGEYLTQTWRDVLGIDVQVEYVKWWEADNVQIFWRGWGMDYNDAYNFLHDGMENRSAFGNWNNPRYENLLTQSAQALDPEVRKALFKQAEEILVETDTVIVPLYNYNYTVLTKPYLDRSYSTETYYADWRLLQKEAVISTTGGSLTSYEGDVVIDIPAGTFTNTVHLVQGPATGMPAPAGLVHIGQIFNITATYEGTDIPAQPAPGQAYTLTVTYANDIPALEDTLALYYWDGSQWVEETTNQLDVDSNKITVHPTHFSTWAVMGESRTIYLPTMFQ